MELWYDYEVERAMTFSKDFLELSTLLKATSLSSQELPNTNDELLRS